MYESVVVTDSRKVKTVSCAEEVKAYAFLNTVRLEVELDALFIPRIVAGENAVTGSEEKSVAFLVSWVDNDAASPVTSFAVCPVIAVCSKRE